MLHICVSAGTCAKRNIVIEDRNIDKAEILLLKMRLLREGEIFKKFAKTY